MGQQVTTLQEWYEKHWDEAEDVTAEILRTIERHTLERSPFEIYTKSLQEFFRSHEMTVGEWELAGPGNGGSRMYPTLDKYQRDGYQSLMKIANQHGGAFLCAFQAGLLTLFIALASPLHPLAERLLQFHMIQHLLLMMVIPPLLLLGAPVLPLLRGLPRPVLQRGLGPFFRLYRRFPAAGPISHPSDRLFACVHSEHHRLACPCPL